MSQIPQLYKSLHPLVTAAIVNAGIEQPTYFQRRVLTKLGAPVPDVIAQTYADCGHIVSMVTWAAHSALSNEDKVAFIVATNEAQMHRIVEVVRRLAVQQLKWASIEPGDDSTPSLARGVRLLIGCPDSYRRCRDLLGRCITLIFEDVAALPVATAVDMIEIAVGANSQAMLCLLSSAPPSMVDIGIRYLLRRSNRAYLPHDRRQSTHFTTLLCHDQRERDELAMRLVQMPDLRRIIVMTHNKEVRDLRQAIATTTKLNTFAIHRATPVNERQRTLVEFIQSPFAVLVTMDAFTGIDMTDVDAVINYYPPQKSMPDSEWETFVACIQSTGDPGKPCLVATIAAPDDVTMVAFLHTKMNVTGPIINITATHPDFEDIVRFPEAAALLRGPDPPPRLLAVMQAQEHLAAASRQQASAASTPTAVGATATRGGHQGGRGIGHAPLQSPLAPTAGAAAAHAQPKKSVPMQQQQQQQQQQGGAHTKHGNGQPHAKQGQNQQQHQPGNNNNNHGKSAKR